MNTHHQPHRNRRQLFAAFIFLLILIPAFLSAQTDSRYDAGKNLPFNEKAGEVNPQTGNITLGATDLTLPGRAGMDFSFGRIWALNQSNAFSMYRNDLGVNGLSSRTIETQNHMGVGWSTTLPYIYFDDSSGKLVMALFFGGNAYELDQGGLGTENLEKSNILGYDLLDLRVYESTEISYRAFTSYTLSGLRTEYGVSDTEFDRSGYVLLLKDNSRYWFRPDGRVMMQEDRTRLNRIWYFYNTEGNLCLVVDTVGRKIGFSYDEDGNLARIQWQVTAGKKLPGGGLAYEQELEPRYIEYVYESAETCEYVDRQKEYVIEYTEPFVLAGVYDPERNFTRYEYTGGPAAFTFDNNRSRFENVYLMLTSITGTYTGDGRYKNKRMLFYDVPRDGMYERHFYNGYMEYYKLSRQYNLDRHGRIMNDTRYQYFDNGEGGNFNRYSAVVETGNITSTYTYSLNDAPDRYEVLESLLVESRDGFRQLTSYSYDDHRRKTREEVCKQGSFAYSEQFWFDDAGNLERYEDKQGLVVVTRYDPVYSIPVKESKILHARGAAATYETERVINTLGQVIEEIIYLEDDTGRKRPVTVAAITYDDYGNPVCQTNALGYKTHTVYDETWHAFPVKVWQDVTIDAWSGGDWRDEPDSGRHVIIRNWQVFNSDGSLWMQIDNEGYMVEHYYDKNGIEIETVNPDENDIRDFALPVAAGADGNPLHPDIDNFYTEYLADPGNSMFLARRQDNPGVRIEIDYQQDFVKSFTDIDKARGHVKVTGVQKDGLDHVEEEIEYGEAGSEYAKKTMTYDSLGRMVGLTDPDAGSAFTIVPVNGEEVKRYDKTWIVAYDDLGRKKKVLYPRTDPGVNHIKTITYNDEENSITTCDPEGRRVYENYDWNGNLTQLTAYGDSKTSDSDIQTYTYTCDELNRKTSFTDPKGIITAYTYDERDLLVEQDYGTGCGSDIMEYNELGQLAAKTDRKGQVIRFYYDEMGRNTRAENFYADGTREYTLSMSYDNRGNAVRISNKNLVEQYTYDHGNRVISLDRYIKDPAVRETVSSVWGGTPPAARSLPLPTPTMTRVWSRR